MDAETKKNVFERIRKAIHDEKKPVFCSELVDEFQLKTAVVNDLLEKFVKKEKAPISVSYVLSGIKNDGEDDIKLLRFVTADDDDIEEAKKYFTELIGTQIKSISPKNDDIEFNETFSKKATLPQDLASLRQDQKLSGITNKLIKLRLNRLNKLINNGWKTDENSSSSKQHVCKDEEPKFTKLTGSNKKIKLEFKSEEICEKVHSTKQKTTKSTIMSDSNVKQEKSESIKENEKKESDKNNCLDDVGNQKKKIKLEANVKEEEKSDTKVKHSSMNGKSDSKPKPQNSSKGKKPLNPNQKVRLITDMFARKEKPAVN